MSVFHLITPEIFNDFLTGVGARINCIACNSDTIYIPTVKADTETDNNEVNKYFVWPSAINAKYDVEPDNAQYMMVCKNCGYVSHYHAVIVIDWYSKNRAAE
ncbi:hypothetical protein RJ498_004721 [Pluralibacter gergoviae]